MCIVHGWSARRATRLVVLLPDASRVGRCEHDGGERELAGPREGVSQLAEGDWAACTSPSALEKRRAL